jgi:hypothetical protein
MELIDQTIVDANTQSAFNIGPTIRHVTVSTEVATIPLFASDRQINPITLACTVTQDETGDIVPSTIVYRINQPDSAKDKYYPFEICVQFTPDRFDTYTINFIPTPYTDYQYRLNSNFVPDGPPPNGFFYRWAPMSPDAVPTWTNVTGGQYWYAYGDNFQYGYGGGYHQVGSWGNWTQDIWQLNGYREMTMEVDSSLPPGYTKLRITLVEEPGYESGNPGTTVYVTPNGDTNLTQTLGWDSNNDAIWLVEFDITQLDFINFQEDGDGTATFILELLCPPDYLQLQYFYERPDNISVGWDEYADVIVNGVLHIARANDHGLYNSAVEGSYGDVGWQGPAGTLWALEGYHGNPEGTAFNLDNVQNFFFTSWEESSNAHPPSMEGNTQIIWIVESNTFLYCHGVSWTREGGGGFSYWRSPTDVDPEAVYIPPRDIPAGWILFNKPPDVDNTEEYRDMVCDELYLARGDSQGLYNDSVESFYNDVGNNGPADTLWAVQGCGSNSALRPDELTVENAEFLFWESWKDASGGHPPAAQGMPAICRILTLDGKYFLNKMIRWDAGEEFSRPGFSLMRTGLLDGFVFPPPPPPYVDPTSVTWELTNPGEWIAGVFDRTVNDYMIVSIDETFNPRVVRTYVINKSDYSIAYQWGAYSTQSGKSLGSNYASGWNGTKVFAQMGNGTLNWWDPVNQTSSEGSTVMLPGNFPSTMAALNDFVFLGDYEWAPWGHYDLNKFNASGTKTAESLSLGFTIYDIFVAKSGAIFAAGSQGTPNTTVTGPSVCKLNPALAISWTYTFNSGGGFGGEIPMAYNELSGAAGILYVADFYNGKLYVINTNTGVEIRITNMTDIDTDTSQGVLRIQRLAADATGVYALSSKYNDGAQKVFFISADGATVTKVAELRAGNEYNSTYKWIFINNNDIVLTTSGDTEMMIYPRVVKVPKI